MLTFPAITISEDQLHQLVLATKRHRDVDPDRAMALLLGHLHALIGDLVDLHAALEGTTAPMITPDETVHFVPLLDERH